MPGFASIWSGKRRRAGPPGRLPGWFGGRVRLVQPRRASHATALPSFPAPLPQLPLQTITTICIYPSSICLIKPPLPSIMSGRVPSDGRVLHSRPPAPGSSSSDRMYVDRDYLFELHQKAQLWDQQQQQQETRDQLVSRIASIVTSAVPPNASAVTTPPQLAAQIASMVTQATNTAPTTQPGTPAKEPALAVKKPAHGRGKFLPDPAVPRDRTLIIKQLPNDMASLMHRISLPGRFLGLG